MKRSGSSASSPGPRAERRDAPPSHVKRNRFAMDRYDQLPTFHSRYVHASHRDEYALAIIPRDARVTHTLSQRRCSFKALCINSLHPKASDDFVQNTLYQEFKRFGEFSIRINQDRDERVAFLYFLSSDAASEAMRLKPRIAFNDKSATVTAVYECNEHKYKSRSIFPEYERNVASYYQPPGPVTERRRAPTVDQPQYPPHPPIHREFRPPMNHHRYMSPRGPVMQPPLPSSHIPRRTKRYSPPYGSNYLHNVRPDDPQATSTLYVGNLEVDISEEELRQIFGRYGQLHYIDIKRPSLATRKAFAFVYYEHLDMAHRAKLELSGRYIGKFQCKIGYGKANLPTGNQQPAAPDRNSAYREPSTYDRHVSHGGQYLGRERGQGAFSRGCYQEYEPQRIIDKEEIRPPLLALEYEPSKNNTYEPVNNNITKRSQSRIRSPGPHTPDSEPDENISPAKLLGSAATLLDVARKAATQWSGALLLKSLLFPSKLYLTDGDQGIATILMKDEKGLPNLRITQRLRMNQSKLNNVEERIRTSKSHAIFLALPGSESSNLNDDNLQGRPLRILESYLKEKDAAGVLPLLQKTCLSSGVLYAFPPCQFSADLLRRTCHNLTDETLKQDYLVIVVICGVNAAQL